MDENHRRKHKRKISLRWRFVISDKESTDCNKEKREKLDLIGIKHLQDEVSSSIFKVGKIGIDFFWGGARNRYR